MSILNIFCLIKVFYFCFCNVFVSVHISFILYSVNMFNTPIWRKININILFKSILGSLNLQYVDCMYTYDALINALKYVHLYTCVIMFVSYLKVCTCISIIYINI